MRMNGGCCGLNEPAVKNGWGGGAGWGQKKSLLSPTNILKNKKPPSAQRSDKNVLEPI